VIFESDYKLLLVIDVVYSSIEGVSINVLENPILEILYIWIITFLR
jgi:hypothetical protein